LTGEDYAAVMPPSALENILVVDLSRVLAGPLQ
jgi:hypothetical protein